MQNHIKSTEAGAYMKMLEMNISKSYETKYLAKMLMPNKSRIKQIGKTIKYKPGFVALGMQCNGGEHLWSGMKAVAMVER